MAKKDVSTKRSEEQWEKEQQWPIFQVEIEGDETYWQPRPDDRYWEEKVIATDEETGEDITAWVPKAQKDLPKGATLKNKGIHMTARGAVTVRAQTDEQAKMMALRDNPDYHTVTSVKEIKN